MPGEFAPGTSIRIPHSPVVVWPFVRVRPEQAHQRKRFRMERKERSMNLRKSVLAIILACTASTAWAASGDPMDIYAMSDAHSELYEFERNPPFTHVPGSYTGALGGTYSMIFSNSGELASNAPYLGAVGGNNQNFFIGGFSGLVQVNSVTGTQMSIVAGGFRLGPARALNGNIVVGGPSGSEEYNGDTGAFIRTIMNVGDGSNMHAFNGNEMFVASWFGGSGFGIKRFNFVTGASSGADIAVPFAPQEIGFGPDGALYATALYEGPGVEGLWRYDNGSGTWAQFIDVQSLAGGGPHGFTYDPVNFDVFLAFNTGEIYRFNGLTGAYIDQAAYVPTKLTDVLFKTVIPEPATAALLALGVIGLISRRKAR